MNNDSLKISTETLDRLEVPNEIRQKLERLLNYDFSFLTSTFNDDLIRSGRPYSCEQVYPIIARFGKADNEMAQILETEFKKFVSITLINPGVPHAPSGAVDMYWHYFLLHSQQYNAFCEEIWGNYEGDAKYRYHYPATDETRQGQFNAYLHTRDRYVDIFGEPPIIQRPRAIPSEIWDNPLARPDAPRTCGDSYSGIIEPNSSRDEVVAV